VSEKFRFPFIRPSLPAPERWVPYLDESYGQRRFANGGPLATRLESELEALAGCGREAVAVASGTAGLVAALLALDVRGRVALPSFTFPATAQAVRLAGCEPLFCEVSRETWELDPAAVAAALADGAAAVLHVRAFGLCRDLDPLDRLCRDARVPLVVDSAAALGGRDERARPVGAAGAAEVFSLHATKSLGIGEGGVVFAEPELAARIRRTINFGLTDDGDVAGVGLNGKLSEFAAAVGLAVVEDAPAAIGARASAAAAWSGILGARGPARPGRPAWQTFPLLVPAQVDGDAFAESLARRGLQARRYYRPALHRTTAFAADVELPLTDELARRMVCLPIYVDQTGLETREMAQIVLDELSAVGLPVAA
jgi:dTDP-4-amino-4,6-dideoxygalactose transaminase